MTVSSRSGAPLPDSAEAPSGAEVSDPAANDLLINAIGPACHELRSPLAVVYGFAKMLQSSEGGNERYVDAIIEGSQRIDQLLDDLASLGRIAGGRLQPSLEKVSLRKVVDDVASTQNNHVRVQVDGGSDVDVEADPSWLAEACKAVVESCCFEEGVDVNVSWRATDRHAVVDFSVGPDNPLPNTDPQKARLGLAVARMRLTAMGGTLDGDDRRISIAVPRPDPNA